MKSEINCLKKHVGLRKDSYEKKIQNRIRK